MRSLWAGPACVSVTSSSVSVEPRGRLQGRRMDERRVELVARQAHGELDRRVGRGRDDDGGGHVAQRRPVHVAQAA